MGLRGQCLLEFAVGALIAASALFGAAYWVQTCWSRTRCVYQAFEATHARLIGRNRPWSGVRITENRTFVEGEAQCGPIREKVKLPRLQPLEPGDR